MPIPDIESSARPHLDLEILIVSFNTRDLLRDCLRSIYRYLANASSIEVGIGVLDNGSSDGSAEMIIEAISRRSLVPLVGESWLCEGKQCSCVDERGEVSHAFEFRYDLA